MEPVEFGSLYERYAPDVLRFALYLTGSRAEAEDITSETFVRAWIESDAIRVGTVKAYLFMIARNLHVDWRRREARLMRSLEGLPYESIAAALGLSSVAARVKVHRARMKLNELRAGREGT